MKKMLEKRIKRERSRSRRRRGLLLLLFERWERGSGGGGIQFEALGWW